MALILVAAAAAAAATAGGAGIRGFLRKRKEGQGEGDGEEGSRVAEGMSRQSSLDEIDLSEVRGAEAESVSSCLSAFPPAEEDREEQHSHYSTATVALSEGGREGGEGGAATDLNNSSDTIQMHTVD